MMKILIDYIYTVPPVILRVSLTILASLFLLGSTKLAKRFMPSSPEDTASIIGMSSTVAVIYAMFIGFIIYFSLANFSKAQDSEKHEAIIVDAINYEASFLPAPLSAQLHKTMQNYLEAVIYQEWPALHTGKTNTSAEASIHQFMQLLTQYKTTDPAQLNIWTDLIQKGNDLKAEHHIRTSFSTHSSIGKGIWVCLIATTLVMLISNSFFYFKKHKTHYIFLICLGSVSASLIFLEINVDQPYRGYNGIKASSLRASLTSMKVPPTYPASH